MAIGPVHIVLEQGIEVDSTIENAFADLCVRESSAVSVPLKGRPRPAVFIYRASVRDPATLHFRCWLRLAPILYDDGKLIPNKVPEFRRTCYNEVVAN